MQRWNFPETKIRFPENVERNFLETEIRFSENVECNLQHLKLLSLAQLLQIFVPDGPAEFQQLNKSINWLSKECFPALLCVNP